MVTNELTTGVTVYFVKKNDVKDWVINELKTAAGEISNGVIVQSGDSTAPAIISGRSYTILDKQDGVPSSYGTITIDSATGAISTTSATAPGTYMLYIRNTGSYNITTYSITVLGGGTSGPADATCCDRRLELNKNYYDINNNLIAGNTLINGVRSGLMSYSDRIRLHMALASKR